MSKFERLYSFNLCSMDLGCPLLRGLSDCRLRKCAATPTKILFTQSHFTDNFQAFAYQAKYLEISLDVFAFQNCENTLKTKKDKTPDYNRNIFRFATLLKVLLRTEKHVLGKVPFYVLPAAKTEIKN